MNRNPFAYSLYLFAVFVIASAYYGNKLDSLGIRREGNGSKIYTYTSPSRILLSSHVTPFSCPTNKT